MMNRMNNMRYYSSHFIAILLIFCMLFSCCLAESYSSMPRINHTRHVYYVPGKGVYAISLDFGSFFQFISPRHSSIFEISGNRAQKIMTLSGGYGSIIHSNKNHLYIQLQTKWLSFQDVSTEVELYSINIDSKTKELCWNCYVTNLRRYLEYEGVFFLFKGQIMYKNHGKIEWYGSLQDDGKWDLFSEEQRKIIQTHVSVLEVYDTAILIKHDGQYSIYDGNNIIDFPNLNIPYDYLFGLIWSGKHLFCIGYDGNYVPTAYMVEPGNDHGDVIAPPKTIELNSTTLCLSDGFLYGIWDDSLYSFDVNKTEWAHILQLEEKLLKKWLHDPEIFVYEDSLYYATSENSSVKKLYYINLKSIDEGFQELISVEKWD